MSLRLRLSMWYGGLAALVIVFLALVVYLIHGRSLYDDVDRELAGDASQFAPLIDLVTQAREDEFVRLPGGEVRTFVRLYDGEGDPLVPSNAAALQPPIGLTDTFGRSEDSAYTDILGWLPGAGVSARGSFYTADRASGRARVYVLPVGSRGVVTGYVLTWSSLSSVDRSVRRFQLMLIALGIVGVAGVGAGGYALSGRALRPVRTMTRTAETIAHSRSFSRRVPAPAVSRGDELGQLARTFNQMLEELEASYAAQQRFMADAAHELRAPLTVLRGNLELLERIPGMAPEDRQAAVASLHEQARRLGSLVDELLLLARSDVGQTLRRQPVELHEIVTSAVADVRSLPDGKRVSLKSLAPITLTGDGERLRQVVTVLLDNARKYTPPDTPIRVSLEAGRDVADLRVVDEGPGIPPEDLPHVFERFYRGDRARACDPGGAGLGLAIARAIVEEQGGDIGIRSAEGIGTTVTVRLPVAKPAS